MARQSPPPPASPPPPPPPALAVRCVYPELDGGRYPVKSEIGRTFVVRAELEAAAAGAAEPEVRLKWRNLVPRNEKAWQVAPMTRREDGRWQGAFPLELVGRYQYTVEALPRAKAKAVAPASYPVLDVVSDPENARFSAWYTMWARSQGTIPGRSATFKEMEARLPYVRDLGFDVVFLSPIHPIGRTKRKGKNGALVARPEDPGSPYGIGNAQGGHLAVNPELGTLEEFRHFVRAAGALGMAVALDLVLQCSPDHPYVREHPGWFHRRPDGSIQYAENPPKKYEDVYPLNFNPPDREAMWNEMKAIFLFWVRQGVKLFRVDNPHTKPLEFWEWLITEVKREHPEVVFLAEAFVFYEKLEAHAKIGFGQSYTYFTWRNGKDELIEYFYKLTQTYLKDFLRGNLFTTTPNILPEILQHHGRPAFKLRAALAATLSSAWGIYNGFELCENRALPGKKEDYLDSEIFEYKVWDWDRPGNIQAYLAILNRIRRENPALQYYDNLRFYGSVNDAILCYGKVAPDRKNAIIVAANLDPTGPRYGRVSVETEELGVGSGAEYAVRELITDRVYTWKGRENAVVLDPQAEPVQIFRVERR